MGRGEQSRTVEGAFDVIVAGLGAMGSSAAYHLAKRGAKVLGLEARNAAHDQGSSHGESRIIRQAYFEDPAYVPLVLRAYELWEELEAESGHDLLNITGGLSIGSLSSSLITGCLKSARAYGLAHDLLDAKEMKRRFPQFELAANEVAFHEQQAGYLRPEECIKQHLHCASRRGADLRFEEPILSWTADESGEGVSVVTERRSYHAKSLVLSVGPWTNELVPSLPVPLTVSRRVMFWFRPTAQQATFDKGVFPIFLWEPEQGPLFYGFPRIDENSDPKVAIHHGGEDCTPSSIDRSIRPRDVAAIRSAIEFRIPALNGEVSRAVTCMYTMTPDQHFIIDAHPRHPQVSVATGFSGHGFKFSSAVGETLAELAMTRKTSSDIALFSASRFHPQ
jgi:sarcosine oxidase